MRITDLLAGWTYVWSSSGYQLRVFEHCNPADNELASSFFLTPIDNPQAIPVQLPMATANTADTGASAPKRGFPVQLSDADLFHDDCCVDGNWTPAKSGRRFEVYDPGTDAAWGSCPDCAPEDVDVAVQAAHHAFLTYSRELPKKRAQLLLAFHQLVIQHRDDLAKILVHETGKPLAEAYGEIDYGTTFTWWFVGEAERIQGTASAGSAPGRRIITWKQPIGVAVALVPWNFPIALVLRKMSAALAAGCTMVVKPSPETPITALCLAHLAIKAGFPTGVLNVLTTSTENTPAVSEALCLHPLVKKVTFTGSTRVGRIVAGLCAQTLKKSTLELGGNCPFIIFDDANLDDAIEALMALKWRHAGQACITANRVYIQQGIYQKLQPTLIEKTQKLKMGHGMTEGITLGPVTTPRSLDKAEEVVADAIKKGAQAILGDGRRHAQSPDNGTGSGYFMAPTILTDMTDDMLLTQEEVFAPVLGLYAFETEAEVVKRANDTSLGLASYVFTNDANRLWRLLESLEAGMIGLVSVGLVCFLMHPANCDPQNSGNSSAAEAPFGGMKDSGWGKESGKDVAINEFLITKTATLTLKEL